MAGAWGGCSYVLRADLVLARGAGSAASPRLVVFDTGAALGRSDEVTCRWATPGEATVRLSVYSA